MSHDDEVVEMVMLVMANMRSMTIMKEENDDARDDHGVRSVTIMKEANGDASCSCRRK